MTEPTILNRFSHEAMNLKQSPYEFFAEYRPDLDRLKELEPDDARLLCSMYKSNADCLAVDARESLFTLAKLAEHFDRPVYEEDEKLLIHSLGRSVRLAYNNLVLADEELGRAKMAEYCYKPAKA